MQNKPRVQVKSVLFMVAFQLHFFAMKILFLFLFFSLSLFAAGPVTHLYLAERYCTVRNIQDEKWKEDFIVGSLFPDIRYTSHLPREQTHFPVANLNEIHQIENGFEAGMKFHNWVDEVREAFVIETGIYEAIRPHAEGHEATLLKFTEEEVLADLYDGRQWSPLFDQVLPEEQNFGIANAGIERWHMFVQYTIFYRISWLIWGYSYYKEVGFGVPSATLYNWSYLLPKLAQEPLFQNHMRELLKHIESQF